MLERMDKFFDSRLDEYDAHQLGCIASAREFLRFTAEQLPSGAGCAVLDLGCGTGLELEEYFAINPTASVTGIDLAPGMLNRLAEKFPGRDVRTVLGSYFDLPFGSAVYDAAVSVESLHHFTAEEKLPLYRKLREALKPGGVFVLTDYFSLSDEEETAHRAELLRLKKAQNIIDDALYHFDTPLTPEHEAECLEKAGFSEVRVLKSWGATHTLRAVRPCLSAAVGPGAPDTAELGCCGAYCRTCREYMVSCKGCSTGYADGSRELSKARCAIKKCCLSSGQITCSDCSSFDSCPTVQGFYSKGYKYSRYQASAQFIRSHGYRSFAQAASAWTSACGKLPR